jgi:predicted enzyme related to lactoylglutathione lyase
MGRPVVHFEVIGKDGDRLRDYYAALFDWKFEVVEPMRYGIVKREDNPAVDGSFGMAAASPATTMWRAA